MQCRACSSNAEAQPRLSKSCASRMQCRGCSSNAEAQPRLSNDANVADCFLKTAKSCASRMQCRAYSSNAEAQPRLSNDANKKIPSFLKFLIKIMTTANDANKKIPSFLKFLIKIMITANDANKKIPSFLKLLRCAGPSGSRSVVSTSWFLLSCPFRTFVPELGQRSILTAEVVPSL